MTGRMTFYDNEGKILTALDPDPCLISSELAELAKKSKEAERESDLLSSSEDEDPVIEEKKEVKPKIP